MPSWLKQGVIWAGGALAVLCLVFAIYEFGFADLPRGSGQSASVQQRCPGTPPDAPERFTPESKPINPYGCDLAYSVIQGTVVLEGPFGDITVSSTTNVVGQRDNAIYKSVRAQGSEALMYYMLCPKGKGPRDGGWSCRS